MSDDEDKPFIPRDKPKSWVIFLISVLSGLLIAGPVALMGAAFDFPFLLAIGRFGFIATWTLGVVMWALFMSGLLRGKYRAIKPLPWSQQVW